MNEEAYIIAGAGLTGLIAALMLSKKKLKKKLLYSKRHHLWVEKTKVLFILIMKFLISECT